VFVFQWVNYFKTNVLQTTQDEEYGQNKEGVIFRHKVNCVCMRKVCDVCVNEPASFHCKNCVVRKKTWMGDNALDAFCRWLFSSVNKGSVALAHNASGRFPSSNYDVNNLLLSE
jgi:hypothetical protein